MSQQLDLLAPVHRADGPESRAAARKVRADDQYRRVLLALLDADHPLTDDELADRCGMLRTSAGTRRGVAVKRGLVAKAGVGRSALGNPAAKWFLTVAGVEQALRIRRGQAA